MHGILILFPCNGSENTFQGWTTQQQQHQCARLLATRNPDSGDWLNAFLCIPVHAGVSTLEYQWESILPTFDIFSISSKTQWNIRKKS